MQLSGVISVKLKHTGVFMALLILFLGSKQVNAQCASINNFTLSPQPTGGTYAPGTVVNVCATVATYPGLSLGGNPSWFEGFDINMGSGWVASSLTPVGPPPANAGGGVGNWIWIAGTFNANGNSFGPGYFFDYDGNGQTGDDWGDYGTVGPWTMCFTVTVGSTPGASLSLNILTVSDGDAGSFTGDDCPNDLDPSSNPITPFTTTISSCLNPPVVSVLGTTPVQCPGQSTGTITLSASGGSGAGYTFQVNGTTVSNLAVNLASGTYSVSCTDGSGCPSMPVQAIVQGPAAFVNTPTITQTIVCNSLAENFQPGEFDINTTGGTAPYTYTFNGNSNTTGIFNVTGPGTFAVNLTDANGCASDTFVTFTAPPMVPVLIGSLTDAACSGAPTGAVDINSFGSAGPFTYELIYPSGPVINNNGVFPNLSPGDYIATVVSASGCRFDTLITIGEESNIAASIPVTTNVACFGNSTGEISLSASGGTAPYTISTTAGLPFTGIANNASVTFTGLPAGNYVVTIEDNIGCSFDTPPITITQPAQALAVAPSASGPICEGTTVGTIQANISGGTAPYNTLWSNASNAVNLNNLAGGTYSVTVTDNNGCTANGSATITETPLPTAPVGPDGEFCQGSSYTLTYTGTPVPGYTYEWTPATGLNNNTSPNPIATPTITTAYTLVVTDINGCSSAPSIPVTVTYHPTPATPVINASGPLEFCAGNSVTLSIGGGVSYLWSNGALTSAVTTAQSGTFFAQLTDAFGCVSLNSAPVDVLVNPLPAAPILSSSEGLSFCQNGSSILTASQPIGIEWNTTETTSSIIVDAAGVYSATYTDANNCESATASIALSIIPLTPPPTIIASGLTTLCQGDSVVLTSSSADSYQWTKASAAGTIIGTSNSIIANATDTYTVETSGLCPSLNMTASINVTVRPLPEPIIAYDTTIIDCLPSVIPFTATATGLGPLAYGWNFGDGNGAQALNANHEYQAPGLYTVSIVAIDQFGCTGYQTIPGMVKILPRADLKYSITPQSVSLSNAEVTFNGLSQNSTNDNWQIMLIEDGSDTTDIAAFDTSYATHTFADTGVYTITYTVTTAEGCVATAKDYVNVYEDFEIFIPMGFSPDGDGINDEFFPVLPGFEIDDYEFRIFNRWGRQVFLTYSTSTGWSGDDMPIGYYFWKIKGKSRISQEPVDLDGYLFLLRN